MGPSDISTFWSKATDFALNNQTISNDSGFFVPLIDHTIAVIKDCNEQEISNILWSNAVMNATSPEAIAPIFSHLSEQYKEKNITLSKKDLRQIYQAYLWFTCEHGHKPLISRNLLKNCIFAFALQ